MAAYKLWFKGFFSDQDQNYARFESWQIFSRGGSTNIIILLSFE